MLRIKVEDTGYGIPDDKLGLMFQPFNRRKELTNIEGTGIGLTITRRTVELMDGYIGVESVVEKGSTFYVDFKRGTNTCYGNGKYYHDARVSEDKK